MSDSIVTERKSVKTACRIVTELNIGAHISLGLRPRKTVELAAQAGLRSMQIFASSPGAWKPPVARPEFNREFRASRAEFGVDPVYIHAIYLINLASADPLLLQRSKSSLIATLHAAVGLGAAGVITHLGSHAGRGFSAVVPAVSAALVEILRRTPEGVDLVLENSAGAGGLLGSRVDELGTLVHAAGSPERLKVALDTAHLFAAGWDLCDPHAVHLLVTEVEHHISLDRLVVLHANDSAQPRGSRRDRHAPIGEGHIGIEGFRALMGEEAFRSIPWILETPALDRRAEEVNALQVLSAQTLELEAVHGP